MNKANSDSYINSFVKGFFKADEKCDKIPVLSTLTNLIEIIAKGILWISKGIVEDVKTKKMKDRSICRLNDKSLTENIILLFPVAGQIFMYLNRGITREEFRNNHCKILKDCSNRLRNDKDFVLEAVKRTVSGLAFASAELRNDKDVALAAVKADGLAIQYVSDRLKNDEEVLVEAWRNVYSRPLCGPSVAIELLDKLGISQERRKELGFK